MDNKPKEDKLMVITLDNSNPKLRYIGKKKIIISLKRCAMI